MINIEEFIKVHGKQSISLKKSLERILSCIKWNKIKYYNKENKIKKKSMNQKNKLKFYKINNQEERKYFQNKITRFYNKLDNIRNNLQAVL